MKQNNLLFIETFPETLSHQLDINLTDKEFQLLYACISQSKLANYLKSIRLFFPLSEVEAKTNFDLQKIHVKMQDEQIDRQGVITVQIEGFIQPLNESDKLRQGLFIQATARTSRMMVSPERNVHQLFWLEC